MVNYVIDDLVKKAGGRYGLVTLIQKRMRELQRGLPSLVERKTTFLETAIDELVGDKVWLATGKEAEELREKRAAEMQSQKAATAPQSTPALGAGVPAKKPKI